MTSPHKRNIAVLGSTGSIGTQTLDVIARHPDLFRASLLVANTSWQMLAEQALRFRPEAVCIANEGCYAQLREALASSGIEVHAGAEAIEQLAAEPQHDTVIAAMVGYSGLPSVLAAAKAGKRIALANKETLVAAGELVTDLCERHGAELLPVDSEHSAIFQCLQGEERDTVSRIILTASGGPFRTYTRQQMEKVTLEDALNHPNWQMGRKVTIDSASMMNKGFEMIEARWLFSCQPEQISIMVHPQSVVHSMVEFHDGAIKAQLGVPDMHLPIAYALSYPHRLSGVSKPLTVEMMSHLTFESADTERFPMLAYAYEAIKRGGTAPAILAAADEIAVQAFIDKRISFTAMANVTRYALDHADICDRPDYAAIIDADRQGRALAQQMIQYS